MELPNQEGDLLQNSSVRPPGPTVEELEEKVRALKRIIEAALVALVILACGVNAYMWRQSTILTGQLAEAKRFVEAKEPMIRGLISSLQGFAKAHPDFQTILSKYMEPPAVKPAVAPANAPAPMISK